MLAYERRGNTKENAKVGHKIPLNNIRKDIFYMN